MTEFLANFSSGDMEPVLKSEEIPATNDDDVKVVVGKNFAEIVLDKKNDVLLEFYAPWCGHCKKLAPIYDELASSIAGSPGVVIAKFDGSNNDSPPALKLDVQGFPTIMLFKAGSNEVVTFQGDRTMKSMLAFLQENAVNGKKIVVEAQDDDEEESEEL